MKRANDNGYVSPYLLIPMRSYQQALLELAMADKTKLTLADVKAVLTPLGMRIHRTDYGDYRVYYSPTLMSDPKRREDTAYYTPDLQDALDTGIKQAEWLKANKG